MKQLQIFIITIILKQVLNIGYMLHPPARNAIWLIAPYAPKDTNYDKLWCGSPKNQWGANNGSCGVCGDSYNESSPQEHQNGGKFGRGQIVGIYPASYILPVTIHLSEGQGGVFRYSICSLTNASDVEKEDCFTSLKLNNNKEEYLVRKTKNEVNLTNHVVLPKKTCGRCVLRWEYSCSTGSCRSPVTIRNCADIIIYERKH